MRNFKIFLWIFVILLIQTVILAQIRALGAIPSLVLVYAVCVMILENEFRVAVTVSIICAASMGALGDRGFALTTLFYVYSSIVIFSLRDKPAYVGNLPKALFWTFLSSFAAEIMYYASSHFTVSADAILNVALPTALFNTVMVLAVYPLLKITMYRDEKKRKLIQ